MRYTVNELIDDKELRNELTGGTFFFEDRDGAFSQVDFGNESMRKNHIAVFEELYAIGGAELFDKLIATGNTCLTTDPNAAKVGVQPVNGAEGYYLKTNASFAVAFSSILNGLAGLDDDDRFSFGTDDADDPNVFCVYEQFGYSNISFVDNLCSVEETEDGSFVVVNPDTDEQISFLIKNSDGELRIDSFYKVTRVECLDYPFDDGSLETNKYIPVVYKYKLSEDGLWGYFNGDVSQIMPPMFEDIALTSHNGVYNIVAWERFAAKYRMYTGVYDSWHINSTQINTSRFFFIDSDMQPGWGSYIDYYNDSEGNSVILYFHNPAVSEGLVLLDGNGNSFDDYKILYGKEPHKVSIRDNFLTGTGTCVKIPICEARIQADAPLHAKDCYHLYFCEDPGYEIVRNWQGVYGDEYSTVCLMYKDGYYAIASYKFPDSNNYVAIMKFEKLLTPFAFTDITRIVSDFVLVDRFGKKGVFSFTTRGYVIPCEYESICRTEANTFDVSKGGLTGTVYIDGTTMKWKKKLHRED